MAAQLGLVMETFLERYARKSVDDGCWELMEEQTDFGFDCVLLERCDETGKTICLAHDSRPVQCRTWPFWPDNLKSKKAWNRAAKSCEGIGRGPLIPLRVILDEKERTPEWGRTP